MEKYIHAFWHVRNTDYQKLEKLWKYFGSFEEAWKKGKEKDFKRAGLKDEYWTDLGKIREKLDLEKSMEKLWESDIAAIGRDSLEYPESLRQLEKPPFLIYRKGANLREFSGKMLAIVGMRKSSLQGEKLSFSLAKNLALNEAIIVSGLAFGIDAAAHSGAVSAKKPTIGVLASGIGKITPSSHFSLAEKILAEGGSIISEYPVTSDAFKQRFLERNRLIAGLAKAVIVVEAGEKSGALITAEYALHQGKDILAFPGDPGKVQSRGCNSIIKNGEAQLVDSIRDVLEYWGNGKMPFLERKNQFDLEELRILQLIERGHREADDLFKETGLEIGRLQAILGKLELAGAISRNNLQWAVTA